MLSKNKLCIPLLCLGYLDGPHEFVFLSRFQVLSSNIAGHKLGQNGPVTFYAYSKLMSIYTTSCVTKQVFRDF